ncbi:MAG TPA: heterodisulfide reductase subunit C, partial [Desulfobacterales bacterium]|nr:heterodisulfide reductase subunit C [Desulfobacterales bacterium]
MTSYDPSFAREVFENVDYGEEIKMCMQCGVCAASCPLSMQMDYSPRKIFLLIRA